MRQVDGIFVTVKTDLWLNQVIYDPRLKKIYAINKNEIDRKETRIIKEL